MIRVGNIPGALPRAGILRAFGAGTKNIPPKIEPRLIEDKLMEYNASRHVQSKNAEAGRTPTFSEFGGE
jgi:hypothetical protein